MKQRRFQGVLGEEVLDWMVSFDRVSTERHAWHVDILQFDVFS